MHSLARSFATLIIAVIALSGSAHLSFAAHEEVVPAFDQIYRLQPELEKLTTVIGSGLLAAQELEADESDDVPPGVLRSRRAQVSAQDLEAFNAARALRVNSSGSIVGDPQAVAIDLFEDLRVKLVKIESSENELGYLIWRGAVVGGGEATFVLDGEQITGVVRSGSRSFRIQPERGAHKVVEFDGSYKRLGEDFLRPPAPPESQEESKKPSATSAPSNRETAAAFTDPATIRLLIVYTAAAAQEIESIGASISLAVEYVNTAMQNSRLNIDVVLAGTGLFDYDESSATMETILTEMKDGAGEFARVQKFRANVGADLVQAWIGPNGSPDSCGLGYLLESITQSSISFDADFGVSVVATDSGGVCLTGSVAHELGHNLGSEHDRYVVDDDEPGPTEYNFGYVDLGSFRDIMAYNNQCEDEGQSCPEIQYFSNPDINFQGRPTGVAVSDAAAAHSARKIGETAQLVSQFDSVLTPDPLLDVGRVSSSLQTFSGSFLRFHNTGVESGVATVTLRSEAGAVLGTWTSSTVAPDAELQFSATDIESQISPSFSIPQYYSAEVRASFPGYFQHVLYRPSDGTLTNLSTCSAGVTAGRDILSGVHSSLIASGFPSTVAINNTGSQSTTVSLGIYDARTGNKRGTYVSPTISASGQALIEVTDIEAAINAFPTSNMYHYVVKAEGTFNGFLQHLVNNVQAGVVTDMTTACSFDGFASAAAESTLRVGAIFSTQQSASQSFLRFHNTGASGGTVVATVRNFSNGNMLGQWTSSNIPANSELQFSISSVEEALSLPLNAPDYYTVSLTSNISGYFQHVLWRPADGTLTNLSTCKAGVTAASRILSGVHSSVLGSGFPSSVVVNNTSSSPAAATLTFYDARDGAMLGTYSTGMVSANGHVTIGVDVMETDMGVSPASNQFHYIIQADSGFPGFLQHLVNNVQAAVITDMTTGCTLP